MDWTIGNNLSMCMHIHICVCMYVYNKNNNESLARIILLIIQVTGNILEHKQWNIMIKKKERKEEIQGKAVDGEFSHPYLPKSPINFTGVSWLLSPPNSSLLNYKALKFYSPEGKRWYPLLTFFLSCFFLLFTYWILKIQGDTRVFTVICFV